MSKNVLKGVVVLLAAGLVSAPAVQAQQRGGRGGFRLPPLLMETSAFPDGGIVPLRYTGAGDNVQPAFTFSNAPEETVSYALILHDVDVAIGGNPGDVLHWMAWNIPASAGGIPEGRLPDGAMQSGAYRGPGAPAGPRYHHYVFELYALNTTLDVPTNVSREDLLAAMQGKVVAKAAYVGRFRREG